MHLSPPSLFVVIAIAQALFGMDAEMFLQQFNHLVSDHYLLFYCAN